MDVGVTETDGPLPTAVPPQLPLYHCQLAPVPNVPPTTESVVEPPSQIVVVPDIEEAATEGWLTVTVTETQAVKLHIPSARTKYVVVPLGETVIEEPLPAEAPPQDEVYHCQLALVPNAPPTTLSVVDCPLQITVVPEIEVGSLEGWYTVIVALAQLVLPQVPSALAK